MEQLLLLNKEIFFSFKKILFLLIIIAFTIKNYYYKLSTDCFTYEDIICPAKLINKAGNVNIILKKEEKS